MQEGLRKGQAGGLPLWNELRLCGQWAELRSAFYGPGTPGGAGPHPAEPQGPGQMAAGRTGAGAKPRAWLWKPGEEWPTGGSVPTGTSGYVWHGPVPRPAVAHWTDLGLRSAESSRDRGLSSGEGRVVPCRAQETGSQETELCLALPLTSWSWKSFLGRTFPPNEISFRTLRWESGSNKPAASEPPPHHFLPAPHLQLQSLRHLFEESWGSSESDLETLAYVLPKWFQAAFICCEFLKCIKIDKMLTINP